MLDLFEIVKTLMLRPHLLKPIGLKTTANEATILEMFKKADADNSGYLTKARAIVVVVVRSPKRPTAHAHALASLVAVGVAALVGARSCGHTPPFLPPLPPSITSEDEGRQCNDARRRPHVACETRGMLRARAARDASARQRRRRTLPPPAQAALLRTRAPPFPLARRRRTS